MTGSKQTCTEHQGLVISCSKIDEMHKSIKENSEKLDTICIHLNRITTQKEERWKVQGWFNRAFIGAIVALMSVVFIEWLKFKGGN